MNKNGRHGGGQILIHAQNAHHAARAKNSENMIRGRDQDQPPNALRLHGRHLRGDPSAERRADEVELVDSESIRQLPIYMRDIVGPIHPVRQSGPAESGVRRRDDPAFPAN